MQNLPDQHARHAEVVGVLAGAGGLAGRVDHRDGFADNGEVSHQSLVLRERAASCFGLHGDYLATLRNPFCSATIAASDGLIHLVVSRTAAQVAAQRAANFCFGRLGILRQQCFTVMMNPGVQ